MKATVLPQLETSTARSSQRAVTDTLRRPLQDLRISVIDQCNFRCPYCMPEEHYPEHYTFLKKSEWLTFEEIDRLVRLFVSLGVVKVRVTGGEPLLRKDLPQLISKLTHINGIEDLALTTNGFYLLEFASALKAAGLKRLTVSLDTLDEKIFQMMNGRRGGVKKVLDGIQKAHAAGFTPIKINVVVQRGINEHTILGLVEHFKNKDYIVRFLEYMDVGNRNHWDWRLVVPSREIIETINTRFPLNAVSPNYTGEVASRYQFADGTGEVGFISSISQPFCSNCTRARLSPEGKFYTCLFASDGIDLRAPLRSGASDEQLLDLISTTWRKREDRYSELRDSRLAKIKTVKKIEMYQIGG